MTDTHTLSQHLIQRHAALQAGDSLPLPAEDSTQPVWKNAVMRACATLGFLPHDATCIARAWQAQTDRLQGFDPDHWPDTPEDFGIAPLPRTHAFPACPQALGLYAVLPDAAWVQRMADAGVPTLQLRFKSDDPSAIAREVQAAVRAVEGSNSLLFINDHWQQAIAAGAYGVHLGQEDMAEAPLETLRAAGLRLGLSTHGYAEMLKADAASPSYLALGAVYPTTLKRMATAPQGTGRLNAYAALMKHHSLVGIGGIDESRIPQVLQSGVGSIAVVRAITGATDPEAAAARLQKIMRDWKKH